MEQLDHLAVIRILGDDAVTFLQGQLTNDIEQAGAHWQYSGYCNPKGRLLAIFMLWRQGSETHALVEKDLLEATLRRLRMYVLRSKVSIEVLDEVKCLGCFDNTLIEKQANLPAGGIHVSKRLTTLSYGDRFLLIDWTGSLAGTTGTHWLEADIQHGIPRVTANNVEQFIPQMINLDIIKGINFKKGCYTGQEIVARMHYLGKLKQRMYLCQSANDQHGIAVGDRVTLQNNPDKNIGTVVSTMPDCQELLVVLRVEELENEPFLVNTQTDSTVPLTVKQDQPYQFES